MHHTSIAEQSFTVNWHSSLVATASPNNSKVHNRQWPSPWQQGLNKQTRTTKSWCPKLAPAHQNSPALTMPVMSFFLSSVLASNNGLSIVVKHASHSVPTDFPLEAAKSELASASTQLFSSKPSTKCMACMAHGLPWSEPLWASVWARSSLACASIWQISPHFLFPILRTLFALNPRICESMRCRISRTFFLAGPKISSNLLEWNTPEMSLSQTPLCSVVEHTAEEVEFRSTICPWSGVGSTQPYLLKR